jgi:two-component system, OmpR family, sensor histidine kinase CpxA
MIRGMFLKMVLWFWASLVLVALALHAAVIATSVPTEVRVQRFSDTALAGYGHRALSILEGKGVPALAAYLQHLESQTRIHAVLIDENGRDATGHEVTPGVIAAARRADELGFAEMQVDGGLALKAHRLAGLSGRHYDLVASTPIGLVRLLHDAPSAQLLRLLAVLITAGAVCYPLARYVARPLASLRAATQELAGGNLAVRVAPAVGRRRDELADLARDFDRMAERIEALMTSERRLLRDISHELRSPLSRLHVALGLARQQAGDDQRPLDRIEREAERLNALIGQLLMLARLESGAMEPAREAVDLAAIVRDVAEDADFEVRSRGRAVRVTATCECVAIGAPDLLRSAVENIVRNAVRHTREGTAVEVSIRAGAPRHVVITVRDHGSGVPDDLLPHIFHPFYRVGDARDRHSGGVGLGLTIADRTIRLHGGTVRADNAPDGGLVVELRIPVDEPAGRASTLATAPSPLYS